MIAGSNVRITLACMAAVHAVFAFAQFVAPYDYAEQRRDYPYAPPTRVHLFGAQGHFHTRPFVYGLMPDGNGGYREDLARVYPLRFRLPGKLFGVDEPGVLFVLGSDGYGRDVFSRMLHGGRVSLLTGLVAALIALTLGVSAGAAAGFYGGWTDRLLMRGAEVVMALPWLYLLLGVRAMLPLRISGWESFGLVVAIIGGIGWVRPARIVRGVALSARERGYVAAARGFGASNLYLIRRHVLPATGGAVLAQAVTLVPHFILAEVTLSFLGLGAGEPLPSWGAMLAEARQYHALTQYPWLLAPAFAALPILLGYMVLADRWERRHSGS